VWGSCPGVRYFHPELSEQYSGHKGSMFISCQGSRQYGPLFMMPMAGKHHCMQSETKSGLNGKNITTMGLMKKLDHKWLGPYPMDKVIAWACTNSNCQEWVFQPDQSQIRSGSMPKWCQEWPSGRGFQRGLLWNRKGSDRCVFQREGKTKT